MCCVVLGVACLSTAGVGKVLTGSSVVTVGPGAVSASPITVEAVEDTQARIRVREQQKKRIAERKEQTLREEANIDAMLEAVGLGDSAGPSRRDKDKDKSGLTSGSNSAGSTAAFALHQNKDTGRSR